MIVVSCGAQGCLKFVSSLATWQTSARPPSLSWPVDAVQRWSSFPLVGVCVLCGLSFLACLGWGGSLS